MLLGTDRDGRTAWHIAAERGNSEIFKNVWEWAKENLTEEINNKLLLGTDKEGRTAWHLAASRAIQRIYKNYGSGLKRI